MHWYEATGIQAIRLHARVRRPGTLRGHSCGATAPAQGSRSTAALRQGYALRAVFAKNGVSTCPTCMLLHFGHAVRVWPCSRRGSVC